MRRRQEESSAFLKQSAQKTFAPPAFERPQLGHSKALVNESFLLPQAGRPFFQKSSSFFFFS
jgi:hypothetical protein